MPLLPGGDFRTRRTIWATYPVASASGDAGEAMPVEESGNMLLLCDGIAKADGSADFRKALLADTDSVGAVSRAVWS